MTAATRIFGSFARWLLIVIVALMGLVLGAGGAQLAWLGGSLYYLLAGVALLTVAVLLVRRDRRATRLYMLLFLATIAWAIAEAGFDGWALMPRILAPALLGACFLPLIWQRRKESKSFPWTGGGFAAGAVLALVIGTAAYRLGPPEPADPVWQMGRTSLPGPTGFASTAPALSDKGEWLSWGGDTGGSRFSPLDQITPANVAGLKPAWTFRTGLGAIGTKGGLEATPLKVGDKLFICTGASDIFALDAETGRQIWKFQAQAKAKGVQIGACRGVAHYSVPNASGLCASRILSATIDARLVALDAETGRPCPDFGSNGQVSLLKGLGHVIDGYYYVTSAPTLIQGNVVVGGWVSDGQYWGEPSGVIRAFDAKTGKFAWAFDIGRPNDHGEPAPGKEYTRATPNSWAPMSADDALGTIYVPLGNATPDYYGAQRRPMDDAFSSSVVALDGKTGALKWRFQTTRHDLWDYDVASQPSLVDLKIGGRIVPALVQPTKRGELFVLDRRTGKPLRPVVDRPVPTSHAAPGERIAPTQPFSPGMPSFRGPDLRERDMWGVSPLDQLYCRIKFRQARYEGTMTPPGLTPSINQPGYLGGMNWGGVSIDRSRNLMIVNSNRVPVYAQLVPRKEADRMGIRMSKNGVNSEKPGGQAQAFTPFGAVILPFLSPSLSPCNEPPFGLITAVDLNSGKVVWHHRLGTARDSGPFGTRLGLPIPIGLPNIGGSIVTKSGLVFIGATQERRIRALDVRTGEELWSSALPAGGQATPATYWSDRSKRQFVVISAGGNVALLAGAGDTIVAYALPAGGSR